MSVIYQTDSASTPESPKDHLHQYHTDISDRVTVEVIGCVGNAPKIDRIILAEVADVSDLESWLGTDLRRVNPE